MYRKKWVKRKVLPEETAILDILGILFTLVVGLHSLRVVVVGNTGSSTLGMLASEYLLVFLEFVVCCNHSICYYKFSHLAYSCIYFDLPFLA